MPPYDGPTIKVKEMREMGLLQEINRRLLHPLGLALEVIVDAQTGEERIERLWDARDDPEGWNFAPGMIDPEKAAAVDLEIGRRAPARMKTLGYIIQPTSPPPTPEMLAKVSVDERAQQIIEEKTGRPVYLATDEEWAEATAQAEKEKEIKSVQVRELEIGALFAWRDTVWKIVYRTPEYIEARGEQFSNVQTFEAAGNEGDGVPTWFTYVRPLPNAE